MDVVAMSEVRYQSDRQRDIAAQYAKGGTRDVRIRAVVGTQRIEQGVRQIENFLGGIRFVGRRLALRYHGRDDRYEWRVRNVRGSKERWRTLGARVPTDNRLWLQTKDKIEVIERRLDMRQDGRAVLRVVGWLATTGVQWPVDALVVDWEERTLRGHVWWTIGADGRTRMAGNFVTPDGPVGHYGQEEQLIRVVGAPTFTVGPYATQVGAVVARCEALERRLGELAGVLRESRPWVRLYYKPAIDVWEFRRLRFKAAAEHVTIETAEEEAKGMAAQPRSQVLEAVEILRERRYVLQVLKAIAAITEGGAVWPGGQWEVKGKGKGAEGWWVKAAQRWIRWEGQGKREEQPDKESESKCGDHEDELFEGEPI
jgi:hypothetical protein